MFIKFSYPDQFEELLLNLKDKYPKEFLQINGISDEYLDITKYSKNYFKKKHTADSTMDQNANVQANHVATYHTERFKGHSKLNSMFLLWDMLKKLYGTIEANRLMELEFNKTLNMQDSYNSYLPYSYYGQTPILLKINNEIKYWTLKQLYTTFETFSKYVEIQKMDKIVVEDLYSIYDYEGCFLTQNGKSRYDKAKKSICPYVGDVKEKIKIEVWDNGKWINLKQIIRHKHEDNKNFIIYQTNGGDFAFVTEDHPIILQNKKEKLAKDLKEGDEIIDNNILPSLSYSVTVPQNVAYITGFILGDGNVHGYTGNLNYIKRSKLGKISPSVRLCRKNNTIMVYQKNIKESDIYLKLNKTFPSINYYTLGSDANRKLGFTSQAYSLLYSDYFNCGISSNSFSKRLPENIFDWDESSFLALLGGLIDSDGSITEGRIDISLCSYAIINELNDLLKLHGFKSINKRLRIEKNNKLGNNFIFAVAFRADKRLLLYSEKIKKMEASYFNFNSSLNNGKIKDNKISKILSFTKKDITKNSFLHQEIDYVYDITTETGTFYANGMLQHNCYNFSTYDIILNGLPFIDTPKSIPPKHAGAFLQHVIQMCMFASNQLLGATSIGDVLIVYSYLLQKDSLNKNYFIPNYKENSKLFEKYLEQEIQQFIFTLNQPVRQSQSIFTNITLFDSLYLNEVKKLYFFDGDKTIDVDFTMYIQKKFLEYFIKFNKEQLFTFPVLTAQFKIDENNEVEDKEFFNFIAEMNLDFANINIFASHYLTALSSCCRLVNNVEDILKVVKEENMNLIGGSSLKVGSFGVTTINLPRLSYEYKLNEQEFFKNLEERVVDTIKINNARRELIKGMVEKNQLPLYTHNFIKLDSQYSTVGILGFYECLEILNKEVTTEEGKLFGIKVLETIKKIIEEKIKKYNYKINCEQVPGESTAVKFALADKLLFKQEDYVLYSNQFIPLSKEVTVFKRIELQAEFEKYFSGGTILHINSGEKIDSVKLMKRLISTAIKNGVQYHAINYFFSQCINNHICVTKGDICPICGGVIKERFTRIVGFIVKVSSWQEERRNEFKERKVYVNGQLEV